jgi:hypothetical protein
VCAAAAATARELLRLSPAAALALLPPLMLRLQVRPAASQPPTVPPRTGACLHMQPRVSNLHCPDGPQDRDASSAAADPPAASAAAARLALLSLLPVMASQPAAAPYATRLLTPLLAAEAPEPLRCLALKLLADPWLDSGAAPSSAICRLMTSHAPPWRCAAPSRALHAVCLPERVCKA